MIQITETLLSFALWLNDMWKTWRFNIAENGTTEDVERVVRGYRRASREEDVEEARRQRTVDSFWGGEIMDLHMALDGLFNFEDDPIDA